ncbi:MAG: YfiT family bacillithiol transferase [Bacteroidota bacterium]
MNITEAALEQLRFPVGQYEVPAEITSEQLEKWIQTFADFPKVVAEITAPLSPTELRWRYRPGGWMLKQVVHHCADSHLNSMARFKLSLTEDKPTIRPYLEGRWAELADSQDDDLSDSLALLRGLHAKWVRLLRSLGPDDLARTFFHPESQGWHRLDETIGMYAWHCEHHTAHLRLALEAAGRYD